MNNQQFNSNINNSLEARMDRLEKMVENLVKNFGSQPTNQEAQTQPRVETISESYDMSGEAQEVLSLTKTVNRYSAQPVRVELIKRESDDGKIYFAFKNKMGFNPSSKYKPYAYQIVNSYIKALPGVIEFTYLGKFKGWGFKKKSQAVEALKKLPSVVSAQEQERMYADSLKYRR